MYRALLICSVVFSPVVWAAAQLLSSEPWGVSTVVIPSNQVKAVTLPLIPADSNFATYLGAQLQGGPSAQGDVVYFWESPDQSYSIHQKLEETEQEDLDGLWINVGGITDKILNVGDSLFIRPAADRVLALPGRLPMAARSDLLLPPGFELKGHPFPAPAPRRDAFGEPIVYNNLYTGETFSDHSPRTGEAWWRNNSTARRESYARPYAVPYGGIPQVPVILGLVPAADRKSCRLTGEAPATATLEVFSQSVASDQYPGSLGAWKLAGSVSTDAAGTWEVSVSLPDAVEQFITHLFLVAVQQDSDGDGKSDAEEVFVHADNPYDPANIRDSEGAHLRAFTRRQQAAQWLARTRTVIYVDAEKGGDDLSGDTPSDAEKFLGHGPKKTLPGALIAAPDGDAVLEIASGSYTSFQTQPLPRAGVLTLRPHGLVHLKLPRSPSYQRTERILLDEEL